MSDSVRRFAYAAAAIVVAALAPAAAGQTQPGNAPRVVGVGDVHGAYDALVALLEANGIVDADARWAGGDTHVVSLGDLLDRGPDSRRAMDLLMRLQQEAAGQGGRVDVVLGNHEHMNLVGDLRYVSDAEYAAFADDEPAGVREAAFAAIADGHEGDAASARAAFDERFPPGYFGHRIAFAADGRYGRWLLSLPAIVVVGETAFMHGGVPPLVAETGADEINARVRSNLGRYLELRGDLAERGVLPPWVMQQDRELATAALEAAEQSGDAAAPVAELEEFLRLDAAAVLGSDGPLWYRGTVYCKPIVEGPTLDAGLERLGARRVVVGHTPTGAREITTLYDGKVVMADTGMLASYYSGRPAALVLDGDRMTAEYLEPRASEPPRRGSYADDYGFAEAELIEALRDAEITSVAEAGTAPPLDVTLRFRGETIRALFYSEDRDGTAAHEIAAYRLSDLLELDLVPPTVARRVRDQDGALQLRYSDAISEKERVDSRVLLGGWCALDPQLQMMYAFDTLLLNRSRNTSNLLYRRNSSNLFLTGHAETFASDRRISSGIPDGAFALSPALERNLTALDEETLGAALGEWLDDREIRALLSRRDEIVERF